MRFTPERQQFPTAIAQMVNAAIQRRATPMSYQTGHIKRDSATGAVALRTTFAEDEPVLAAMAWIVASATIGARHATTAEVDSWDNLYTPPAE